MEDTVKYILTGIPLTIWAEMKKICTLEKISIKKFILNSFKKKIKEYDDE